MATREIVGWSISDSLEASSACAALRMAIQRRQPPAGLIHHSDRGVQYASGEYQKLLARHGLRCSMSRRGNCYDTAPASKLSDSLSGSAGQCDAET
jgi:putative transposase